MSGIEIRQSGATTIFLLARPQKRNAISADVASAIQRGFAAFDASDQRVAIIAAIGDHFSAGADLNEPPALWRALPTLGITTEKPIICAVSGWCVGGAILLAALSDLCIATEDSRFYYPEGKVGLTGGAIAALAGRIPHKFAMEIMMLGRVVSGRRAYEMGLVNEVVPDGTHLDAALAMARELEAMAPLVLRTLKRFVTDHILPQSPSERMARAQRDLSVVNESADLLEGVAAFREGRDPRFSGQ